MYDKVLIHVDRKNAFERYLPFLESVLQRKIAKEAVLTTVVAPCEPTLYGYVLDAEVVASINAWNHSEAKSFLEQIAKRLEAEGMAIEPHVLVGDPNEAFRTYATQGGFDLVVIAPTGRRYLLTGKSRAFRRTLRQLRRPVMILQAMPQSA
jgi:nucleotide-binding universal stress UspA family protein